MTGESPSHQELLDWLAVEFRESGWDIKKCFRLMVTSATYRQAATVTPEKLEKDPVESAALSRPAIPHGCRNDSRLRARRQRVAVAEDRRAERAAVSAAGSVGGGGDARQQSSRNYVQDHGESLYRRSMYTLWKRAAPPASMEIFNAPTREVCTVRRERTNTPLQALVTLNDTQFVEAARVLAEQALKDGGATTDARLDYIAERLLGPAIPSRRT